MLKETIKKARLFACLTQEEMADLLNMSKTKYLRKENGTARFERDEVIRAARILNIKEDKLLTFWMSDSIYEIVRHDKRLVAKALFLIRDHLGDYDTSVRIPLKSNSYSINSERLVHIYK